MATSARNTRTATTTRKAAASKKTLPKKRKPTSTPAKHTVVKESTVPDMVMAEVPDKSILTGYVSRKVMGGKTEFESFDFAYANAMNVIIEGPTGPGKTTSVQAWCALRGLRFGSLTSFSGADHTQMFGRTITNENAKPGDPQFIWVDGLVTDIFRNGGVLLVNEANMLPERIQAVLFGPTDSRRALTLMDHKGEVIKAHRPTVQKFVDGEYVDITCWCDDPGGVDCRSKWVLIIADFNPDYEGTRTLNKAFRNRWAVQLVFDYDPVVEAKLIRSASLRGLATDIRNDDAYDTPVATNMLIEFEKIALGMGIDFACQNFINHFLDEERDTIRLLVEGAYKANIEADLMDDDEEEEEAEEADDSDDSADDPIELTQDEYDWIHSSL